MSLPEGYHAATCGDSLYIRVVGTANMTNALHLEAFASAEVDRGITQICMDLSRCNGMDSTFMGTMVGLHNRLKRDGGRLVILNPTETNRKLVDMLGLSRVMPVLDGEDLPDLTFVPIGQTGTQSFTRRIRRIQQAHRNLVSLSERNRQEFSAFLASLDKELADRTATDPDDEGPENEG